MELPVNLLQDLVIFQVTLENWSLKIGPKSHAGQRIAFHEDPETLGWGHPTALENSQAGTFNIGYDLELTARSKAPNQYIHDLVSRALYYRWVTGSPLEGVEPEPIIIPSKTGSIIPYSNQLSRVFSGWWFHLFYFFSII